MAPINAYGRTKLAGERAVIAAGGEYVILRTSWVFSGHGENFVGTMLRLGSSRPTLSVVDDQVGGPTPASAIAKALIHMARCFSEGNGVGGVYHYSGTPDVSWRLFAETVFGAAPVAHRPEIRPISSDEWPTPAARPRNSKLDCGKILRQYGIRRPDWRSELQSVIAELMERRS